jgi:hypothetical protein
MPVLAYRSWATVLPNRRLVDLFCDSVAEQQRNAHNNPDYINPGLSRRVQVLSSEISRREQLGMISGKDWRDDEDDWMEA